jgi:hypothetical protein
MRMIFAFLSLLMFSVYAGAHVASGSVVPDPSGTQFKSPLARNLDGGISASSSESTPTRCRELSSAISQAIASPDRKNIAVQGMGSDGKPRNELRQYDKRANLESEYRQLGCR